VHAIAGMLLFMVWPFTRLVHALSAPLGYLFRPYVVYRTKDESLAGPEGHAPRRGWERIGS
jgi:nitrate reductase gamma subunit